MSEFWNWFEWQRPALKMRENTFAKMFEYLDSLPDPISIIETGTVRTDGSWDGDGQSTVLFDRYAAHRPGTVVRTVDINPEATALAARLAPHVKLYTGDSVEFLRGIAGKVDLLYLDSFDYSPETQVEAALHHMNELRAALPAVRPETLVVVDDTVASYDDLSGWSIYGKGTWVADFARLRGAWMMFSEYQIGWTHMVREEPFTLPELLARARHHVESGEVIAADQLYRLILQGTSPTVTGWQRVANGEAHAWFARQAIARRRYSLGAEHYRAALAVDPKATDYRLELCRHALVPIGQFKEALVEAQRAVAVDPELPDAWHVLGGVYHEMNEPQRCIEAYDHQLELAPDDPDALLDRITIAIDVEDYRTAKTLSNTIINGHCTPVAEREADAYQALGVVAYRENRHHDAIAFFDKAIAGRCAHNAMTHWFKSISLHSIGKLKEGWVEHEHRKDVLSNPAMSLPARRFNKPMWTGQPPPARLHVHYEAGAGDNLCLVRYLDLLVDRGYTVCLETDSSMVDLFTRSFPRVEVVSKTPDWPGTIGLKNFDYHVPIGSLPPAFGTDIDTIPAPCPYLVPNPVSVEQYRLLVPRGAIGICWSAGIRDGVWIERYGRNKSMPLSELMPMVWRMNWGCVSLQVGPEREELRRYGSEILDVLPKNPTWDDTAALISCLDAVVTVDTGVAHLAGALGANVHLAMHTQGSWHFMADVEGSSWQDASPWYPTMKVHRQKRRGEWYPVVEQAIEALTETLQ